MRCIVFQCGIKRMLRSDSELVSVVIPTRNRGGQLETAVRSVLAQTWKKLEIMVVDDASTDGTTDVLRRMVSLDSRVMSFRNDVPQGGARARNQGVELTKGEYVAFLDDDDVWHPDKLMAQVLLLKAHPEAAAVSCGFEVNWNSASRRIVHVVPPVDEQQLLRSNCLGGASMCVTTRKVFEKVGGFDPLLRSGQDWDLWIKLFHVGSILVCPAPLVQYLPHQGPRISTNLSAVYQGRRKIFFRYQARMSLALQQMMVRELVFCKRVLMGRSPVRRCLELIGVARAAEGLERIRYVYRFLKFVSGRSPYS